MYNAWAFAATLMNIEFRPKDTDRYAESEATTVIERTVGNCVLHLVGADHRVTTQKYPLQTIEQYIKSSDKAVLEYFTPELEQGAFREPIVGDLIKESLHADNIPFYYDLVERKAWEHEKNVLMFDPDNSVNFYFWKHSVVPLALATSIGGIGLATVRNDLRRNLLTGKIARRQLLRLLAGGGLSLAGLATLNNLNMDDVRWVTVTQGLNQYCQTGPAQRLAVIYPPDAITGGIVFYLDHPDQRRERWSVYSRIPGLTREIREYDRRRRWVLSQPPTPIA